MKVVNIVLSSLILVLALVCTAFSYFLFEKRTALVGGWDEMAGEIANVSTELAKGSGAAAINKDDLKHETYKNSGDLKSKLAPLASQSKKIISQRDEFSRNIKEIAEKAGMGENAPDTNRLIDECGTAPADGKKTAVEEIGETVEQLVKDRDNGRRNVAFLKKELNTVAKEVGTAAKSSEICGVIIDIRKKLAGTEKRLQDTRSELRKTQNAKREVERKSDGYKAAMESAQEKVRKLEFELNRVKKDFEKLTSVRYNKPHIWNAREARAKISGRVTTVNTQYGYIVIDLNKNTRAIQKIGKHEHPVDPELAEGMEMVVVRGDVNAETPPQFVARIKIRSIDDQCTVANLPNSENMIQVGDTVINTELYERKSEKK